MLLTPLTRMGPYSAGIKMPQTVLDRSAWCRASRARRRDTGCARNEEFGTSFTRDELFSSRSRDPSRRGGARLCFGKSRRTAHRRHQNALKLPIQVGVVSRLPHAAARTRCARNEDFERSFARSELFSSRSHDPSRREVARRLLAKSRQI